MAARTVPPSCNNCSACGPPFCAQCALLAKQLITELQDVLTARERKGLKPTAGVIDRLITLCALTRRLLGDSGHSGALCNNVISSLLLSSGRGEHSIGNDVMTTRDMTREDAERILCLWLRLTPEDCCKELDRLLHTGDLFRMEKKSAIGLASKLCQLGGLCDYQHSKGLILRLAKFGQDASLLEDASPLEHLLGHLVQNPQVKLEQFTTWTMLAVGGDRSFVLESNYLPKPAAPPATQLPVERPAASALTPIAAPAAPAPAAGTAPTAAPSTPAVYPGRAPAPAVSAAAQAPAAGLAAPAPASAAPPAQVGFAPQLQPLPPQANLKAAAAPRDALPPSGLTAALQQQRFTQPPRLSAACLRPCPGARAPTAKAAATRVHQTTAPGSASAGSCRSQPVPVPTMHQAPPSAAPPPSPVPAPAAVPAPTQPAYSPAPAPAARDPRLLVREAAEKAKQLAAAAAIQKATGASAPTWATPIKQEEVSGSRGQTPALPHRNIPQTVQYQRITALWLRRSPPADIPLPPPTSRPAV